ncbi:MAG: hypothetical protein P8X46_12605, partial [Nitrospirales bacterium]
NTYVVPAQTLFSIKPVLGLFLEIGRLRCPVLHQRGLSFLTIRGSLNPDIGLFFTRTDELDGCDSSFQTARGYLEDVGGVPRG